MKRIVKNFSDFSYLKEEMETEEVSNELGSEVSTKDVGEVEESPLSQISEETGLEISSDERGDFIQTEEGDIIRYFSETGYYNETKKKKYGEDIAEVINSIQPISIQENRRHKSSCRTGCGCQTKRK